jgi:probable F420-dependent oxidoreductase
MRFGYLETMTDPAYLQPLAMAAEAAGYDAFAVPDSIGYPEHSDTEYPYSPDGTRDFLEDKPFIETFALVPYLAATTERIRFTTDVVKLPLRHPVLVAKQVSSIAVISDDRLTLGVGLSPWPEDYAAVGVPWARRGKRLDEMIDVIRGLCAGGYFAYTGEIFEIPSMKICPVPDRPVPILIGGHSEPALRRAARIGDGWIHAGGDAEELAGMIERLRTLRREYGREHEPFEIHVISLDAYTPDGVRRLEDLGVTDVIVGFNRKAYSTEPDTETLEQKLASLRRYAEHVIEQSG